MRQVKRLILVAGGALAGVSLLAAAACSQATPPATASGGARSNGTETAALAAALQAGTGGQQSGLWVSGEGVVNITPDVAILTIGVEAQRSTVAQARDEAAAAMEKLFQALKARGVADRDIRTSQFSIYPVYHYEERGQKQVLDGYQVQNQVVAKIRNLNNVGPIIDDAVAAAGDLARVQGISFTLDNPAPQRDQARTLAIKAAVAKAKQMATDAEVSLGKVLFISESGGFEATPMPVFRAGVAEAGAVTPISPGELQVRVTVQMVYELR